MLVIKITKKFKRDFSKAFGLILILPLIIILLLALSGSRSCITHTVLSVPDVIDGDDSKIKHVTEKYCNPNTGKFKWMQNIADNISGTFYRIWLVISLLGGLFYAARKEFTN